jgi:hypothetical protein
VITLLPLATRVGADQLAPFQDIAYPSPSIAVQNEVDGHDIEVNPPPLGSTLVGADQPVLSRCAEVTRTPDIQDDTGARFGPCGVLLAWPAPATAMSGI